MRKGEVMRIPELPENRVAEKMIRIGVIQLFAFGFLGAVMWFLTVEINGHHDQPWHAIGGWACLISVFAWFALFGFAVILESFQTVPRGNTEYWRVGEDGRIVLAKPGRYWGSDMSRLFKVTATTPMSLFFVEEKYFDRGIVCHPEWTVKFNDGVTREKVVAFVHWYQGVFEQGKDGNEIVAFLRRSTQNTNLPFRVELPEPVAAH